MNQNEIGEILSKHAAYLRGEAAGVRANLRGANLCGADLREADLRGADLREANLRGADLYGANLRGANLCGADLRGANLYGANLREADLRGADLYGANLREADLRGADLREANLRGADLYGANLYDAKLSAFQIPQDGLLVVYKKTSAGVVKLLIPAKAKRTASLVGRKCRAEYAVVLEAPENAVSMHDGATRYVVGQKVRPDRYCDDVRIECSNGIHFFLTREEAEEY